MIMAVVKTVFMIKVGLRGLLQPTRIPCVQKDLVSDASRLLDLGGLAVDRVELGSCGGRRVVHVVTADETAPACPRCEVLSVSLTGSALYRPRDIPYEQGCCG